MDTCALIARCLALVASLWALCLDAVAASSSKPNIVIILSGDFG